MTSRSDERSAVRSAWLPYAAATLLLAAVIAGGAGLVVSPAQARGVQVAAAVGAALQLLAFGLLVFGRERANLFLAGWLGGMVLRFGGLGAVALWVTRSSTLPATATLVTLAGFLFLLLLLEPVFLRRGLHTT